MLLEKLIHTFIQGDIYGVEVLNEKDTQRFFVILCNIKKGKLNRIESKEFQDVSGLFSYLSADIPCVLNITGNGVINKQVANTSSYREKVLFNSKPSSFYWEEYFQNKDIFLSVARKELIDNTIKSFETAKFKIVQINIGSFGLHIFKNISTLDLFSNTQQVFIENGEIKDAVSKNIDDTKNVTIGDEEISSKFLLSYASIANYIFPSSDFKKIEINTNRKEDYLYAKATQKIGIPFVIGLFAFMVVGYFTNSLLNDRISNLTSQNTELIKLSNLVDVKRKDKKHKEEILNHSGIADTKFLSFYAWKLISVLPDNIVLEELNIFPLKRKIEKQKQVSFKNNIITIEGSVNNNENLSTWIKEIKNYSWIESAEVKDFKKERYTNRFELQILISK